jgi:hypothetical protein
VSPGFILPFCRYRPVQADAGMPAWSSLPTELEYVLRFSANEDQLGIVIILYLRGIKAKSDYRRKSAFRGGAIKSGKCKSRMNTHGTAFSIIVYRKLL